MKRFYVSAAMLLLVLSLSIPAFSQAGFFATVTGTVTDSSKALVPGVTVKATAVDTGVVTTAVTNEAGSYTFNNLLPGKYTVSASLPGFQTKSFTDVQLSQNTSSRYNFELTVSGVNTQVEVQISADTILATSGATVGQALSQQKVQALPIVGNNVLDLITVMAGVEGIIPTNPPSAGNAFGREGTTFAGVSAQNVAIIRDGIQVQDNRYPNGIYSATTINPDLVGEIRLILAPVDVEMGRGNGAITYSTRSGTNKFTGSAVWSVMNTSLNPNSWTNNRNQTPLFPGGPAGKPVRPDWSNTNQGTVSFGGPIIKNKTFFFGLFDYYRNDQRTLTNSAVPTACARLGIFRFFNGWNNGNLTTAAVTNAAATAAYPSVRIDGTPVNPINNGVNTPGGLPPGWGTTPGTVGVTYDPSLQAVSMFGALQSKPATADCSDAAVNKNTLVPNGVTPGASGAAIAANGSNGWDPYRKQLDPTGYISRTMAFFPLPNNFEIGDGLNTAGYRFLRHFTGLDNLFGSGEATGRRKQYNAKIDHNFNSNHKANINVTIERVSSDDVVYSLPDAFSNQNFRKPIVLSSGLTSTLSSTVLNEARFGMRRQGTNVIAPWDRPENQEAINKYLPPQVNGFRIIPQIQAQNFCYPHSGVRPPGGCANGFGGVASAITAYSIDTTPTYTYADTLSWTKGTHALKFGGELRMSTSQSKQGTSGFFSNYNIATTAIGGSNGTSSQTTTLATDLASTNPAMPFLLGTNAGVARSLANYYAGSLSDITNLYFITNPNDLSKWSDYRTSPYIVTKLVQNEFSTFAKDDYKISKNLTLNMGIRWDYIGVPYVASGLTVAAVGGGDATFGVSGRDFTGWMNPGERAANTAVQFVGPNSPNKSTTVYPNDYNNFGPAFGFAWNVPWFGEGKTTVRGGYQITYQGGGRFSTIQGALAFPPGSTLQQGSTTNGGNLQNAYLDMTSLATATPPAPSVLPMQSIPINQRTQSFTTFDSHYVSPYVENLTMNVTRAVSRNLTMDVRYVGTFSKKNYTTLNLNTNNYLYNGLLGALTAVRNGTESTKTAADAKDLLNKMFDGINLCSAGCTALPAGQTYGPIGTTTGSGATALYQTAALQMRSSGTFNTNLALGAFNTIAGTLNTLNIPAGGGNPAALTGLGGVLRHANTLYPGQFPENFIATNPQYAAMSLNNNSGYNNYHSLEVQASVRPVHGFSGQATYTWSKNLGLPGTLTDPTNRAADYTNINNTPGQSLRTNGVIELPFGPNKLLMGNSSGWLARAVERWQLGLIYNLNSGAPTTITAASQLYANGVPDIVYPVDLKELAGVRWGIQNGPFQEGRYFDNNDKFLKVADPQCSNVTPLQNLNGLVPATGVGTLRCTLQALAMAVPEGTAGATPRVFNDGVTRPSVVVLQNPLPGKRGTLGQNTIIGLGSYRFDANLGKTFRVSESKSVNVRFDAQNILNHPQPGAPSFSMNSTTPWGQITAKNGGRLFQGQMRFTF